MNKLFEVPAIEREVIFQLQTYKGNRVALKLLRLLKDGNVYTIKEINPDIKENRIFEISIISSKEQHLILEDIKNEIISYIPDNFNQNYLFDFTGRRVFGFVNSFQVDSDSDCFFVSHKIKEVKKGTILPKQITL